MLLVLAVILKFTNSLLSFLFSFFRYLYILLIQLKTIESKAAPDAEKLARKISSKSLSTWEDSIHEGRDATAQENWKLLNQKIQLQRLIERLTQLQTF